MTLQQMAYLLEVAKTGSMNKAAEKLFISQPTLTKAIKEAEAEIGFAIFTRNNRGVTLTPRGDDFIADIRQVYHHYQALMDKYQNDEDKDKKKFGVSTQHYSFAAKAFVEMVRQFGTLHYDFAYRETTTAAVIDDVATGRSEIGILYRSPYNERVIDRHLLENNLKFTPIVKSRAYVYLWKGHPLAGRKAIRFADLKDYPCLCFEQDGEETSYMAEEILSDRLYPRRVVVRDRAAMLNLMVGLNGYTLCSGIIHDAYNGADYRCIPFQPEPGFPNQVMEIGLITRIDTTPSESAEVFINAIRQFFH
ncbi:LysR family transcriptional regulator [Eubacteriaceae bacterium RF-744-FAT-4]|uniref:LysR family transcriptional regulator n=2 Tax=Pseudoramibacter porci TaxID=2606631 RepID=A0A7X2NF18_9FIRM|nr:LysR family transcriptional regulator [Pseudoramibacter porci]